VDWREGQAHQTGLPAACADVVTCVQAFHWMDPTVTLPEIVRLLRPGGVFAAVDYDGPASVDWELERASVAFVTEVLRRGRERGVGRPDWRFWPKEGHLDTLRQSGSFGYVKEVVMHGELVRDASWFVHGTINNGLDGLEPFRAAGLTDEDLGVPVYRALVERLVGAGRRCFVGFRIRFGVTFP
jgi:SAM-dependent methyltransferase